MTKIRPMLRAGLLSFLATATGLAQNVAVYDDTLRNGFQNYSYGGGSDFASATQIHGGTYSIAFSGNNFNAVSFAHPDQNFSTGVYGRITFWVHGGMAGGQQLRIHLQLDGAPVANAELDSYIAGGAIVAGGWREVTVNLGQAPLLYGGSYDRMDLQSDVAGVQPVLYLDDVTLVQTPGDAATVMQIERDVAVESMTSDRFTWRDSANKPRVAVLAHNTGQLGPSGPVYQNRGGALREFRYQMPDNTTRIATVTTYGNGAYGGFGYVVSHRGDGSAGGIGDDSPLGYSIIGSFVRVFEGRHHAIFRFTQLYPRYSSTSADPPNTRYDVPVAIEWVFSTGRDHPLWAITYDLLGVPANALNDDSRAPYGELNFDGVGAANIDGVAWGDRYKFTSTTAPVTLNSHWTWDVANTIPYVKLWIAASDARIGIVQTETMTRQDAGGGRNPFYHNLRPFWGTTSDDGNAGGADRMPWQDSWPYQANSFSLGSATPSNNGRLTWGTQYGFLGQTDYDVNDGVVVTASGHPKQSYSTYIVLGAQGLELVDPVEKQVRQVEVAQSLTLTAATGSVVTSGPAGIVRPEIETYAPAGYNHVYGALTFNAGSNQLDANVAVGAGTLENPLFIIRNYTGANPNVKIGGVTLIADVDYFASLRPSANELWLTVRRNLTGAVNRIEILPGGAVAPAVTTVSPASGSNAGGTAVTITGTNFVNGATVTFGGAAATNVTVVDAGTITAKTPAHAAGAVNVVVTNPDLQSGTKESGYSYQLTAGRRDFNGDGGTDLLWRNYATGDVNIWFLQGTNFIGGANLFNVADPNWRLETSGDFDGNGSPDLLWRNYATGDVNVWFLNGTTYIGGANLFNVADLNWQIEGAVDFNADGKYDILWRNDATGAVNLWYLDGTSYIGGASLFTVADANWSLEGTGDFDGDGDPDLVWRNYATGDVNIWALQNGAFAGGANLFNVADANWKIQAIEDYSNDGKPDLVWRNYATGDVNIWFMNGIFYNGGANLFNVASPNWRIAGPR